jgi:hypothetical protein
MKKVLDLWTKSATFPPPMLAKLSAHVNDVDPGNPTTAGTIQGAYLTWNLLQLRYSGSSVLRYLCAKLHQSFVHRVAHLPRIAMRQVPPEIIAL